MSGERLREKIEAGGENQRKENHLGNSRMGLRNNIRVSNGILQNIRTNQLTDDPVINIQQLLVSSQNSNHFS